MIQARAKRIKTDLSLHHLRSRTLYVYPNPDITVLMNPNLNRRCSVKNVPTSVNSGNYHENHYHYCRT